MARTISTNAVMMKLFGKTGLSESKKVSKVKKPVFHPEVYAEAYAGIMADKYRMKAENYALRYYVKTKLAKGESLADIKDKVKSVASIGGSKLKNGAKTVWNTIKYIIKRFWIFLKELWAKIFNSTGKIEKAINVLFIFKKTIKDGKNYTYKVNQSLLDLLKLDGTTIPTSQSNIKTFIKNVKNTKTKDDFKNLGSYIKKIRSKVEIKDLDPTPLENKDITAGKVVSLINDLKGQLLKFQTYDIPEGEEKESTLTAETVKGNVDKLIRSLMVIYTDMYTIKYSQMFLDRINAALTSRTASDESEDVENKIDELRDVVAECTEKYHEFSKSLKTLSTSMVSEAIKTVKCKVENSNKKDNNKSDKKTDKKTDKVADKKVDDKANKANKANKPE